MHQPGVREARLSRRAVLAGGALVAAAGCTSPRSPAAPTRVDPDARLRADVAADVRRLSRLYDAASAAHPDLAPTLAPLAAETAAHLEALAGPPSVSPSPSPSAQTPAATVPADADETRRLLGRAEAAAADRRAHQVTGASPALARLLASVGAAEAVHAAILAGAR